MTPPPDPELPRRLPFPTRPFHRETAGSFLTRLAYDNNLRIPHLLALAGIATYTRSFTPATDDTRGWSAQTPDRIAALSGRSLPELAAAIPALAMTAATSSRPLRACPRCTAAKNITGIVIIRARPHDYLCIRHRLWHRGIQDIDLTILPEVIDRQRQHNRHVNGTSHNAIARAHQQAQDIIGRWFTTGRHPPLTRRWQDRHRRLDAKHPGQHLGPIDIITHPEMLTVAYLLLTAPHAPAIRPGQITARLGFPYPDRPHPSDPLLRCLSEAADPKTGQHH